jgi:DNA-binding GntR family transcriptional regulator
MALSEERLSSLADIQDTDMSLSRSLLKDRAAVTLRDYICTARIPEGTKLTEREVSTLLGISRAPARDALMALEAEGLVVSRPNGRYVIELTEKDVRDIHALRWTLERLAAELASSNVSEDNQEVLRAALEGLESAGASGDAHSWTNADMHLHRTIWRLADNPQLLKVLDSVFGAIFVLAERNKMYGTASLESAFEQHRELVDLILAGDGERAGQSMEAHLRRSLAATLRTFRGPGNVNDPER